MELTVDQALQQGVAAHREGKLQDAERLYRAILQAQPNHTDANHNLGLLAVAVGKPLEAVPFFKLALDANHQIEQFWLSYIGALITLERFDEAKHVLVEGEKSGVSPEKLDTLKQRLEGSVPNDTTKIAKGQTLSEKRKKLAEKKKSKKREVQGDPSTAEPSQDQINTLLEQYQVGRLAEAEALATSLTQQFPKHSLGWKVLGTVLKQTNRLNESLASMQSAVMLSPQDAEAHYNLGNTLKELERLDEAEASYRQAITLKPEIADAHYNLGNTLQELGRSEEAAASCRQAIILRPDFAKAHNNLLMIIGSMLFNTARYHDDAAGFARAVHETVTSRFNTWSHSRDEESLRIGFVSGDLKSHPVGYFLEGLLVELQSSSIQLFAYPTVNNVDAVTSRLKPLFDMWCPLAGLKDMEAAQKIHGDGIHILIDLSGHTANNRLPVFAWKPAPIQVSWLGYFASTGLPEMDYILGDPYVTPFAEADHFVEKIWQLPESYLCFSPPEFDLNVGPSPASSNGFVTFGCLNQLSKMTAAVVSIRAKILHAVPNSKLLLKNNGIDVEPNRSRILSMFSEAGIPAWRLILEGKSTREEHLACYQRIDIALSPFPYNGGTTSVEGLWMGVPVITLRGDHFVSHVSESIVHNAGLAEWVAADEDEYIAKALAFASDLNALAILRKGLRETVLRQPLFDAERFARHFEEAMFAMRTILAKSERRGASPSDIAIRN